MARRVGQRRGHAPFNGALYLDCAVHGKGESRAEHSGPHPVTGAESRITLRSIRATGPGLRTPPE
jgi:hypothetical protein